MHDGPAAPEARLTCRSVNLFRRESSLGAAAAQGAEGSGPIAAPPERPDMEPARGRVTRFARRHALFGAVLLAAATVRIIVMLGYPGARLIPDSRDYVLVALRMQPFLFRPSGYSAMLWLLRPFHSLAVVIGIQHAMGLGIGVAGYALLRRKGLPGWGATLAMVPVLLSAYALQVEHFLLSDTLFALLVMIAVVAVMWWPDPPLWICALAGLALAAATLVRSQGLPLLVVFLACLLIRFARWRTIVGVLVMCAAFVIPVATYAEWFESVHGTFRITNGDGAFLYAAATAFADCAKIKPPAAEHRLCLNVPVSKRAYPAFYVWTGGPLRAVPGGLFGNLADKLGTDFTLRAIRAQPLDYLRVVWRYFWEDFRLNKDIHATDALQRESALDKMEEMFPTTIPGPPAFAVPFYDAYDPAGPDLRVIQPYAGWIRDYQRVIVVSGPLLGVILLTGLRRPRRGVAPHRRARAAAVAHRTCPRADPRRYRRLGQPLSRLRDPAVMRGCRDRCPADRQSGQRRCPWPARHRREPRGDPPLEFGRVSTSCTEGMSWRLQLACRSPGAPGGPGREMENLRPGSAWQGPWMGSRSSRFSRSPRGHCSTTSGRRLISARRC